MKKTISFILFTSTPFVLAESDWVNEIWQIADDGTTKIKSVGVKGNRVQAERGVRTKDLFELWTIHKTEHDEHLLDSKIVYAEDEEEKYAPEAELTVVTQDSYTGLVPRTREDIPYTVIYNVSGLPTAEDYVTYDHAAYSYLDGAESRSSEASPDKQSETNIYENGKRSQVITPSTSDRACPEPLQAGQSGRLSISATANSPRAMIR